MTADVTDISHVLFQIPLLNMEEVSEIIPEEKEAELKILLNEIKSEFKKQMK